MIRRVWCTILFYLWMKYDHIHHICTQNLHLKQIHQNRDIPPAPQLRPTPSMSGCAKKNLKIAPGPMQRGANFPKTVIQTCPGTKMKMLQFFLFFVLFYTKGMCAWLCKKASRCKYLKWWCWWNVIDCSVSRRRHLFLSQCTNSQPLPVPNAAKKKPGGLYQERHPARKPRQTNHASDLPCDPWQGKAESHVLIKNDGKGNTIFKRGSRLHQLWLGSGI